MGKYLREQGFPIAGYYSRTKESALAAAQFTDSVCYSTLDELLAASDTLFIATGDDQISSVWGHIVKLANEKPALLHSNIICHFSGSLSSDVFLSSNALGLHPASIHPVLAFPDKFHSWEAIFNAFFTLEGDDTALDYFSKMMEKTGNECSIISASDKILYHTATSMLSNHVTALVDIGLSLFMECGFSKEQAYHACSPLILGNVNNILSSDTIESLTGPVERTDAATVEKHLTSLRKLADQKGCDDIVTIYRLLGKRLTQLAQKKHPETDYSEVINLLG
jgi:predicted short-subunit dehydrogenase-like oxidoreductase (DUF2520 family)